MTGARQELIKFIEQMPEMYVEKALKVLKALIEPTGGEVEADNMKKWLAHNLDSKKSVPLNLSIEELKRIEEDEVVLWEDFEKKCGPHE